MFIGETKKNFQQTLQPVLFFFIFLILMSSIQLFANPVLGEKFKLKQPDGTLVEVRIWGDEFYQVVESLDGYTLIRDPNTGIICYAKLSSDKNELISTVITVKDSYPGGLNIQPHIRINQSSVTKKVQDARKRFEQRKNESIKKVGEKIQLAPNRTGNVKGICLIVDFSDDVATIPASEVDNYCNQIGYNSNGNNGSVRDYFYDVSDGHLTYTNYVPTVYYRAINIKSYYDNPSEPCGPKAQELILEALNDLDSHGFDFSQYDSNNDGEVDAINCYYAGNCNSGWAKGLWPHSGGVYLPVDGVYVLSYQISYMGDYLTLGTFCHENGHMLCWWPDLYDYDYDSFGAGDYCLMCYHSYLNPQEPCAYMKYIAGWADLTTLSIPQSGLMAPIGVNKIYKFAHPTLTSEYYLIENRQAIGRDSDLTDSGLAIWHIDTYGTNNWQDMTPEKHYEATVVQADGNWDLEHNTNAGDNTDLYKAPTYTQCTPTTTPNTNWWAGNSSGLSITQISSSRSNMLFTFGSDSLEVSPFDVFQFQGIVGGTVAPANVTYTLTNNGTSSINWQADKSQIWLDVTPDSGTLGPGAFVEVNISLIAGVNNLLSGEYNNTVTFSNLTSGSSHFRYFVLKINTYQYPLDTDPGWSITPGSQWAFGTPTGQGGTYYGNPDPTSGATGSNVYGVNLNGDYSTTIGGPYYLTCGPLDFSGYQDVQIEFQRWLNSDYQEYVFDMIEVSNNGSSWTKIWENGYNEFKDSSWQKCQYDISSIADGQSTVYIQWGYRIADMAYAYSGWNIDDIIFRGTATDIPDVTIIGGPLNFGEQDVDEGASVSQTITIRNDGIETLSFIGNGIEIIGDNADEFLITNSPAKTPLSPAGSVDVEVAFDPSSTGTKSANLRIVTNDSDEMSETVALSGIGTSEITATQKENWIFYN